MREGSTATRDHGGFSTRHRFLLVLLWATILVLALVGLALDAPLNEVGITSLTLVAFALGATTMRTRGLASVTVGLGLVTVGAIVVDYAGGVTYAHFAFFLMVCAVSLYRMWQPLATAIAAVVLYHFVTTPPAEALAHSLAIAALGLLLVIGWRLSVPTASAPVVSGDRFRMSFEEAPIGMAVLKPSGEFLEVNKAMTQILGYDRDTLISANVASMVHADDQAELGDAWEEMGNSQSHTANEWMRWLTARGRPIWGRVSLSLVPWSTDQTAMVILQLEDASHTYEERRRLETLIRGKDEFVATLGDEIRQPLGLLIDLTDLAEHPHVDTRATLPRIEAHAKEIASIVDDLVTSARAETTPVSVVAHRLDAPSLCREVVAGVTDAEHVSLDFGATEMWADPALTRRIVHNLVSNAVRYGGPDVGVRTVSSGPDTVIEVSDDGPEIPVSERERVFSGDLRNGPPATRPAAVGLSLTVGRHLARQMEGDVEYRRTGDGRNVFELRLPSERINEIPRPRDTGHVRA